MVSHASDRRRPQPSLLALALLCGLAVAGLWSTAEARLDPHVKSSIGKLRPAQRLANHRLLQEESAPDAESTGAEPDSAAGEAAEAAPADGAAEGGASAGEESSATEPTREPAGGAAAEGAAAGGEAGDAEAGVTASTEAEGGAKAQSLKKKPSASKERDEFSDPDGPADASDAKEPDASAATKEPDEETGASRNTSTSAGPGLEVVGRGDEEGPTEVPPDLGAAAVAKAGTDGEEAAGEKDALTAGPVGETEAAADGEAAPHTEDLPAPVPVKKARKKRTRTIRKRGPRRTRKPKPKRAGAGAALVGGAASESSAEGGATAGPAAGATGDAEETSPKPDVGEGEAAGDAGASALEKPADAEGAEKGPEDEAAAKDPASKPGEEAPETVEATAEDSGNSGVAQEMALDPAGAAAVGGAGKSEVELEPREVPNPPVVAAVGAPEQLLIEQAALEDEEDYASFMSELFNAGQRLSPAMQALKEKTAKHVVPTVQEFARSSHEVFKKTTDNIQTHMTPLFGPHASPALATVLSFSLLLLPLLLIGALVYQFRFILTLQRLLVLCNLYLCLYCFTLLAACIIISSEPMRSLQAAAEPNFYVLQILTAFAYLIYLGLQFWWLAVVSRAKGKDKDPILIAKAVLASLVAVGIGLHYYIFVFERALLDKPPKINAWAYLIYTALFGLLTVVGRPKEVKQDVGKQT